jgi:translocation and assembly module TamB
VRSGDGELVLTGDTYLGTDTGLRTELVISGEDFEILRLPDWRGTASPDVRVVVDEQRTLVSGEFIVPSADISVKDIPESATSPSKDAIVHRADVTRADEVKRTLDIDLRASLGDDVRLKAFGLNTGLGGSVQLRGGSHQAWRGFGRVELTDGIYKSYGQELTIERGLLIFNGPFDSPQLDIRAVREIDAITAGIHLTGTPSDLRSSVYSDPPLRDAEALSYLLTGRPLSAAAESGDGDLLGNAAFALGLSGAGLVASRVRSQLGLDSLSIEGGADDGRIIAGKRLNSRLLVEYGYGLIDRLGSLLLRYQLNERLVIESRTGTTSEFDIVYRVRKQ